MKEDFLSWTSNNEDFCEKPFIWKELDNGTLRALTAGILEFIPNTKTKSQIVYSCGIHGNETAPIEIVNDLVTKITDQIITCIHHTLFIIGNPKAMNIKKRFTVENLNRLFATDLNAKEENYEVTRAKEIIQILDNFYDSKTDKLHYDLHTAIKPSALKKFAIAPHSPNKEIDLEQLGFLEKSGIDAVVFNTDKATTFSYHSASLYNAKSFTLELGKVMPFGENNRKDFTQIEQTLTEILTGEYKESTRIEKLKVFEIQVEIIKHDESFKFYFEESLPNFSLFKDGEPISSDKKHSLFAIGNEQRVIFPNAGVKNGERAALIIGPKHLPM